MMGKLLKYDFKAGIRIFGFIWLGIVLMTGVTCGIFAITSEGNTAMLTMGIFTVLPLYLLIMGSLVFPFVYASTRFYKGLLGQEGYLMFTLPTEPWKLLTSKLLTAILFVLGTIAVAVGAMIASIATMATATGATGVSIDGILGMDLFSDGEVILAILHYCFAGIRLILQIYLALCLGHLCRGKRLLFAVLFFFALNTATNILTSLLRIITVENYYNAGIDALTGNLYSYTLPLNVGLCVLFFFLCERILRTRLNLE